MELADMKDSKSFDIIIVWVQVPPPTPKIQKKRIGPMTNKERILNSPTSEAISTLKKMFRNSLYPYINYEKFFDSEDEDMTHFLKIIGKAKHIPLALELWSFHNANSNDPDYAEKEKQYIIEQTKDCMILEKKLIFEIESYIIYCPEKSETIMTVPASALSDIEWFEK